MKRLLRRHKRRCDGNEAEERTRTLHLDTAFKNKGFDDMDKIEKGNALIHREGIYSFAHWGTNADSAELGIRVYDTKNEFYKHNGIGSLGPSDETGVKVKHGKKRVAFKETLLIEKSSKEPLTSVETQVGKRGYGFENRGETCETNSILIDESSYARSRANYWTQNIAEDVAKGNSAYYMKTKAFPVKFSTASDRSFGSKMKRASSEGRQSKGRKKNIGRKDSQPYLQNIGGHMNRCISLPNVDTSKSLLSFATYNDTLDDTTSLSDVCIEDSFTDKPITIGTVGSTTGTQVKDRCESETNSKTVWSEVQHEEKGKDYETRRTSSGNIQACEISRVEERTCSLTEDTQTCEDKQPIEECEIANTDAEMETKDLDQSKQNSCKSEHDSSGNDSTGLILDACTTPREATTESNDRQGGDKTFCTKNEKIKSIDASLAGMGCDKIVCGCIPHYSKPPANMEKIPCTCQRMLDSENTYKIDEILTEITDQAQQAMNNNNSRQQRLVGSTTAKSNCDHTVQIHHGGKGLHSAPETKSEPDRISLDTDVISCNEENDTWSLIPSTVHHIEARNERNGDPDLETRSIIDVASKSVAAISVVDDIEERPSTVESTVKKKVNMQEIELRLGGQGASCQELNNTRDVQGGLGEERPASRHTTKLDRLSGLLREIKYKRKRVKPSWYTKRASSAGNDERLSSRMGIEMIDLKGRIEAGDAEEVTSNVKETKIDIEEDDIRLDSTFILEGAREAQKELNSDKERLMQEILSEKSRLANLLHNTTLPQKKKYTIILVLWAIEADMPEEFFNCLNKSKVLNTLVAEQIYKGRELILQSMYSAESTMVKDISKKR